MPNNRRTLPRIEWGASKKLFSYVPGDDYVAKGGVFTRAGAATYLDRDGVVRTAAAGVLRDAHYENGVRTTLVEPGGSNQLLRSQDYSTVWSNAGSNLALVSGFPAPDGTMTATRTRVVATAQAGLLQSVTATATRYGASVWLREGSSPTEGNHFLVYNNTTLTTLCWVTINFTTGVLTVVSNTSGAAYRSVRCKDGWWRIEIVIQSGITIGDTVTAYAGWDNGTQTAGRFNFIWGAQLEPNGYVSSYMVSVASAGSRVTDLFYFTNAAPPQDGTLYVRFIEKGMASGGGSQGVALVGGNDPGVILLTGGSGTYYAVARQGGVDSYTGVFASGPLIGDAVELRVTISRTGLLGCGQSINAAAETTPGAGGGTVAPLPAAWEFTRIYVGSRTAGTEGAWAFTGVAHVQSTQTMPRMRGAGTGGDVLTNVITMAYPLDEARAFPAPAEGSVLAFLPSGEADGWDTGTAHRLSGVVRWIPRVDTVTPAATGWDGTTGWREFLSWARRGNAFWYGADVADLAIGWPVRLEAPFEDASTLEPDMTRSLPITLRSTLPIEGY